LKEIKMSTTSNVLKKRKKYKYTIDLNPRPKRRDQRAHRENKQWELKHSFGMR